MKKFTRFVRQKLGRKSIPNYYEIHMTEKGKLLENIYKVGIYEFDTTDKTQGSKEKRPVVLADAEEVVEKFLEEKNLIANYTVKVMADGGGGKVSSRFACPSFRKTTKVSTTTTLILNPKKNKNLN